MNRGVFRSYPPPQQRLRRLPFAEIPVPGLLFVTVPRDIFRDYPHPQQRLRWLTQPAGLPPAGGPRVSVVMIG